MAERATDLRALPWRNGVKSTWAWAFEGDARNTDRGLAGVAESRSWEAIAGATSFSVDVARFGPRPVQYSIDRLSGFSGHLE